VLRLRKEIAGLADEDPVSLRAAAQGAERERATAEEALRNAEGILDGAAADHQATTSMARRIQAEHADQNRAWREQATAVDRLRQDHEEEDRARLDLERRIGEAERLLEGGHGTTPEEAVAALSEADTVVRVGSPSSIRPIRSDRAWRSRPGPAESASSGCPCSPAVSGLLPRSPSCSRSSGPGPVPSTSWTRSRPPSTT